MELIEEGYLSVGSGHKLYFAQYGELDGIPIILNHGGPGSHSKPAHLDYLPPQIKFRAVLYDQRGCGQSQPVGEVGYNTTLDLVDDIEKLRRHLGIDKWYVSGGSWGSTLSLLYAQKYPKKVKGLILRNIFLARDQDTDWVFSNDGVVRFFPDKAKRLRGYLKKHKLNWESFTRYAYQVLQRGSLKDQKEVVSLLLGWEWGLMSLDVPVHELQSNEVDEELLAGAKVYLHYLNNRFFIKNNQIIDSISLIEHIPTVIIHGRYDMVCPLEQAYTLHQHLPQSRLFITNFAGHHLTWDGKVWVREMIANLINQSD